METAPARRSASATNVFLQGRSEQPATCPSVTAPPSPRKAACREMFRRAPSIPAILPWTTSPGANRSPSSTACRIYKKSCANFAPKLPAFALQKRNATMLGCRPLNRAPGSVKRPKSDKRKMSDQSVVRLGRIPYCSSFGHGGCTSAGILATAFASGGFTESWSARNAMRSRVASAFNACCAM